MEQPISLMSESDEPVKIKAVIYMRCSTDEDRQQVDTQLEKCQKYAELNGWAFTVIREYSSAWNKPRPEFSKCLKRIEAGEFQVFLCYDMDRFSRDKPHIADGYLNKIVHEWECRFISLNDSIDSDDDIKWNIVRHIMVWQSQKYSERLSNRIKEGLRYKIQTDQNFKNGRKRVADYPRIVKLYTEEGWSVSKIAKELEVNKSSVHNALKGLTMRGPFLISRENRPQGN